MVVALRLARTGVRHQQLFHIVAAHKRCKRDGRNLEKLGTYNPFPSADKIKFVNLNFDRTKYWLSVGAQPSERVAKLLGMAGILPPLPLRDVKESGIPRAEKKENAKKDKK